MFIEIRDYPVIPTLRLLHKYPYMMHHMQCDKGAIRHIINGSHVMAPGLTSPGGKMEDVKAG
jgi:PUA domain protein